MEIKISLLVVFFAVMIAIGAYCRKHSTDINGFLLGGRNVGPWLSAFSYGTSYFSAVIFVGYAGQFGWKYGLSATWVGMGNAFIGSLLAWLVLANRTRLMSSFLGSTTMPDFLGKRFDSLFIKVCASVVCFVFLIPYTASLYNGLSRIFTMAFGIDYAWCVIAMALITGLYVLLGGYMATATNAFIQGIIMFVGIIAVIAAVLGENGGFTEAISSMANVPSDADSFTNGQFATIFGPDKVNLLGVVLLTSLGTWGLPQMVSKFYAIKDMPAIKKGTIVSTVFAVVVAGGCYFLGGFGRLYDHVIDRAGDRVLFDSIIPAMLANLPDILVGIVVVLVLSASMSTLSSLVLTSASTITLDFIAPLRKADMDEKTKLSVMRVFITVFIIISATIAIFQAKSTITFIAQLMGISWGALAGAFLAPFVLSLYKKSITKTAVIVNVLFAPCLMISNILFGPHFPVLLRSPINCGVLAMLAGFLIVPIVSLLTAKPQGKSIDDIFECLLENK